MTRALLWLGGVFLVFVVTGVAVAGQTSRRPLDDLWEAHMLSGTTARYEAGVKVSEEGILRRPYDVAQGYPGEAWFTDHGIRIDDFRERALGGLLRQGGWRLEGGLLARVRQRTNNVELYGKEVWYVPPALFHRGILPPFNASHSYDFFLLRRPAAGGSAVILGKWSVPPSKLRYLDYLRGALEYDEASRTAVVRVLGQDNRVFLEQRVKLTDR